MKRFLKALLFALFVVNILTFSVFARDFSDLDNTHWAYPQIEIMAKEGVLAGYPDGTFRPDALATRAEFATMVIKALSQEHSPIKKEINFLDVPYSHWAYSTIQRAVYFDLITGFPDNTFNPEGNVLRAEAVSVAISALSTQDISLDKAKQVLIEQYADYVYIPEWIIVSAGKAEIIGIVAKVPQKEKEFAANRQATRAELAVLLFRMREEAKLNPNAKLREAMRPKKGPGVILPDAIVKGSVGTIPAGSFVPIVLVNPLSSQKNEAGEIFIANAPQNLISKEGYILVLQGSNVAGEITDVKVGRYFVRNGKVMLETELITTPIGQKTDFFGSIDTTPKRNWLARILRAIFKGGKINLKSGSVVYVKLQEDITVDLSCGWIIPKK
ncbi:MAG: S-layer homology domain-containing protein [Candidatus Gastranaerophilales bacterium]|nr:S-layer homology domain-containing protein [Candidatus Gastranaerophilales bacterium]